MTKQNYFLKEMEVFNLRDHSFTRHMNQYHVTYKNPQTDLILKSKTYLFKRGFVQKKIDQLNRGS